MHKQERPSKYEMESLSFCMKNYERINPSQLESCEATLDD